MGLALVVDTNVFLLARDHIGCRQVFQRVCYSWDYMLVIDRRREIFKEYKRFARGGRESPLRRLVSLLIEREATRSGEPPCALLISNQLTSEDLDFLRDLQCHKPIEPQMLGVARDQPHTCVVISETESARPMPIPRGYCEAGIWERLQERFPDIRIVTTGDLSWLDEPGDPAPRDCATLEAFLEAKRLDENCAEREFLELKCPDPADRGIGLNLMRDVMEAVCAMTNAASGYIFIGVEDDGTIHGVPRKYKDREVSSWDELWCKMAGQELSRFRPHKPFLRQWFIPVPNDPQIDLRVVALRVEKQRGGPYSYRGRVYVREGTMSQQLYAVQ